MDKKSNRRSGVRHKRVSRKTAPAIGIGVARSELSDSMTQTRPSAVPHGGRL
jgi:hypothetical protein